MTEIPKIPLDLNSADQNTLVKELEISIEQAMHILALRPYQSVDQLNQVSGLDLQTLARIRALVRVEVQEEKLTSGEMELEPIANADNLAAGSVESTTADETFSIEKEASTVSARIKPKSDWKTNFLLVLILVAGAYFRFTGVNWDENHHQHPDERFITSVAEQIRGVSGISAYFDTARSTLNPLRFGSYTYGMLPLFLTRLVAEWVNMANYDRITLVGRAMSGLFDLAALWMLYLLGKRLYNQRVGLLAAALGAAAVLPIQLSHYFAVDSFSTVFVISTFYFAWLAIPLDRPEEKIPYQNWLYFILFGSTVGLAGACKVSVAPVFGIILLAGIARLILGYHKTGFRPALITILIGWALAAFFTGLFFRIFQPYAFAGPGFFGLGLNQRWLEVIREVTDQVAGRSEWPPNHQWTSQPVTYAWTNMVMWGLGIPLGLAGWLGWIWAGWRMWKGDWRPHLYPFAWVLVYFCWQNAQFWRYMRYFLPIYPFIILFAAWALIEIYDQTRASREKLLLNGKNLRVQFTDLSRTWKGAAGLLALAIVCLGTYAYAYAFTRIYTQPITRIAASRWMLENIAAPLNLEVQSALGNKSYPVSMANQGLLEPGEPGSTDMRIIRNGIASQIRSTNIRQVGVNFSIRLSRDPEGRDIISEGQLAVADDSPVETVTIRFGDANIAPGQKVYVHYKITNSSQLSLSGVVLRNEAAEGRTLPVDLILHNQPAGSLEGSIALQPGGAIRINCLEIKHFQQVFVPSQSTLKVSLLQDGDEQNPLAVAVENLNFSQVGQELAPTFQFNTVQLIQGKTYQLRYQITHGGPLRLVGEAYTLETSWDDALPLSVDQYDALGGIYKPLNLELFEADTPEKREAMIQTLAKSNYIVIPSNRAYDAMPRLPLRYPLTLKYYQALFDCACSGDALEKRAYSLEAPFKSPLGFELVKTFENKPGLGPFSISDQAADESFTVYDHPKVLIFKKSKDFSIENVKTILNSVDLEQVIFQGPLAYTRAPLAFQLPQDRLAAQTSGGSWSEMFSRETWVNANQNLGVLAWYICLLLLGWAVFPVVFTAFGGLPDRGYPLSRMAGLISVAWLAWMLGSLKILPFTRLTIGLCAGLALSLNIVLAYSQRQALAAYLRAQWKHILATELIFLGLFLFSLYVRMGNPDLWHPWLGGEKPMDFAFFNATLKAVYFPPENPWFAGHYLNYYYYGYVLAAIPTKLLGILPSIAYNLILPAWFGMAGSGVFCVGFNLVAGLFKFPENNRPMAEGENGAKLASQPTLFKSVQTWATLAGITALVAVMFLGNLYMLREFWSYLPEAAPDRGGVNAASNPLGTFLAGATQVITGQAPLPGDKGRWYFEASRPILHNGPDTPIAEFPYFTFLFADLHPHLLSMPIYGLALGWVLGLLLYPLSKMKRRDQLISLILAGLIFGSFRAAHTWDFPIFTGMGVLVILWNTWQTRSGSIKHTLGQLLGVEFAFIGLGLLFYQPFAQWFRTEYAAIELWKGARTPLLDYVFVFGLALFVILTLLGRDLVAEIKQAFRWTANSFLRKKRPYLFVLALLAGMAAMWIFDYQVLVLGIPLLLGIGYLILIKQEQSVFQRVTWSLFAVGLALTMAVEVVVLKGDVGRSNTVFRLYNQAWFFFGLAISAALVEIGQRIITWPKWLKISWAGILGIIVLSAASYALVATPAKMADRWPEIPNPPANTLDGAAYMLGDTSDPNVKLPAIYNDDNRKIKLSQDYAGIQYMQEQVLGSPVIVEANTQEYRWGSRYSIYTGLPSVVGWSWHVRQHNSLLDGAIIDKRIAEVMDFYNTQDISRAMQFLNRYQVQYIIVSDLERAYYATEGLAKFQEMMDQGLLRIVFGDNTPNTATIFDFIGKK